MPPIPESWRAHILTTERRCPVRRERVEESADKVGPNSLKADRLLAFNAGSQPPGIEIADPMLTIRKRQSPNNNFTRV